MDLLTLCLCCSVITIVIFSLALILGQRRMRQVEGVMRQMAQQHGAQFTPGNIIFNPHITFQDGDLALRLYAALGGRDDPTHTELLVTLPPGAVDPEARLRLRPHSFATRLSVTLGAKPILTGDQAFDAAFDLRGAPESLVQRLNKPDLRQRLVAQKDNRPVLVLERRRSLLPVRTRDGQPAPLHWEPPAMQFSFKLVGLPLEVADWEPRLELGRVLLNTLLGRPPQPSIPDREVE